MFVFVKKLYETYFCNDVKKQFSCFLSKICNFLIKIWVNVTNHDWNLLFRRWYTMSWYYMKSWHIVSLISDYANAASPSSPGGRTHPAPTDVYGSSLVHPLSHPQRHWILLPKGSNSTGFLCLGHFFTFSTSLALSDPFLGRCPLPNQNFP